MSLAVVGADYPNRRGPGRRFEITMLHPGEAVQLVPEPRNPADPRAVAVFSGRGIQIGYLTAERCGWIGAMLAAGFEIRAVFQTSTRTGAVIRVTFDGSEPILPAARDAADEAGESEFYPDETYPEDDIA